MNKKDKLTITISGKTGSGKTTLAYILNNMLNHSCLYKVTGIAPEEEAVCVQRLGTVLGRNLKQKFVEIVVKNDTRCGCNECSGVWGDNE